MTYLIRQVKLKTQMTAQNE